MSTPYLSEIKIFSFGFAPKGWALCNGQLLPINQNQAIFSLLGTTYGGDGRVNFGLPNLQTRIPLHMGAGHVLGEGHNLAVAKGPTSRSEVEREYPYFCYKWICHVAYSLRLVLTGKYSLQRDTEIQRKEGLHILMGLASPSGR